MVRGGGGRGEVMVPERGKGSLVPGWRKGGSGSGKSGRMLYQAVGISFSSRINFVLSILPPFHFRFYFNWSADFSQDS